MFMLASGVSFFMLRVVILLHCKHPSLITSFMPLQQSGYLVLRLELGKVSTGVKLVVELYLPLAMYGVLDVILVGFGKLGKFVHILCFIQFPVHIICSSNFN